MTPDNPNFAPRCAWPGGNIVTTNKDEALLKYYQRKGIPLPEHLQQKARELESESAAQKVSRVVETVLPSRESRRRSRLSRPRNCAKALSVA